MHTCCRRQTQRNWCHVSLRSPASKIGHFFVVYTSPFSWESWSNDLALWTNIYIYIYARCSFMYSCKNAVRVSVEASTVTVAQWHFLPSLRCGKRTWVASFELTIMPETILSTLLWMFTSSGEISRESTRISRQICAKADIVTRNSRRIYKVSQLRHS